MSTMPFRDNFRDNLRSRLDRGDLTVTELARRADVHRVTIHKILSGEIEPSLSLCEKIADSAGIHPPEKIFQKSRRQVAKTA
jgi:DNA-binding XRE family transcriptional regulator